MLISNEKATKVEQRCCNMNDKEEMIKWKQVFQEEERSTKI